MSRESAARHRVCESGVACGFIAGYGKLKQVGFIAFGIQSDSHSNRARHFFPPSLMWVVDVNAEIFSWLMGSTDST